MDRMTFDIMWKMSEAPESEQCFLRLPQTEYYYEESVGPSPLEFMPDVRWYSLCYIESCANLSNAITSIV